MWTSEQLTLIKHFCESGMTEREIKQRFNLTDWEYIEARKILSYYSVDYSNREAK